MERVFVRLAILGLFVQVGALALPVRQSSEREDGDMQRNIVVLKTAGLQKLNDTLINDTLIDEKSLLGKLGETHRRFERMSDGGFVEFDNIVDKNSRELFPTWGYVTAAILGLFIIVTGVAIVVASLVGFDGSRNMNDRTPQPGRKGFRWLCGFSCFKGKLCSCRSSENLNNTLGRITIESPFTNSEKSKPFELVPKLFDNIFELAYSSTPPEHVETSECSAPNDMMRIDSVFASEDETQQLLPNKNVMWTTEMRGTFNNEGGILMCENSDVKLIIPEGALTSSEMTEIYVRVYLDVSKFPRTGDNKTRTFFVTPVVECGPPGLQFSKHVQLVLPHRVRMGEPSKKTVLKIDTNLFTAVYSNDVIGTTEREKVSFSSIPHVTEASPQSALTFDVNEKCVNINTTHFTLFGCIGPRRKHQLKLTTCSYYNYMIDDAQDRLILQFRLYMSSKNRDTCTSIENTERRLRGHLCTPIKPFNLLDNHIVSVNLYLENPDWLISVTPDIIPHNEFYDDFSSCFQITMSKSISDCKSSISNCIMGKFRLQQQPQEKKRKNNEHTYFQELELTAVNIRNCLNSDKLIMNLNSDGAPSMTDKDFATLSQHIPPKQIRQIARSLSINENVVQQIEHDYNQHGVKEIVFQVLKTWGREKGSEATFETLVKVLEDCECSDIAEKLPNLLV